MKTRKTKRKLKEHSFIDQIKNRIIKNQEILITKLVVYLSVHLMVFERICH